MFSNVKNIAIAISLSLILGFCSGFYTSGQFAKASQLEAVTEIQHQSTLEIEKSLTTSLDVEKKVTASNTSVSALRKQAQAHLKESKDDKPSQNHCNANDAFLDPDIVFLLNSARIGVVGATSGSDGESKATSGIGIPAFIDNDLEVVGMYHELAERHNALVDWVSEEVEKRTK